MEITIFGSIPSQKNCKRSTYNPYTRRVVVYTEPRVKEWQANVDAQLVFYDMVKGPVEISMKIWHKDKRAKDLDNEFTSVVDRLKGKIIEDDNCNIVRKFSCEFMGIDKENPRAEISIKSIDKK